MDATVEAPVGKAQATAQVAVVYSTVAYETAGEGIVFLAVALPVPSINGNSISAVPGDSNTNSNMATGGMPVALLMEAL